MTGEDNNNQGGDGGSNQDDGGNNESVIPEQLPFTNPAQTTTRVEKPIKRPEIPSDDD